MWICHKPNTNRPPTNYAVTTATDTCQSSGGRTNLDHPNELSAFLVIMFTFNHCWTKALRKIYICASYIICISCCDEFFNHSIRSAFRWEQNARERGSFATNLPKVSHQLERVPLKILAFLPSKSLWLSLINRWLSFVWLHTNIHAYIT